MRPPRYTCPACQLSGCCACNWAGCCLCCCCRYNHSCRCLTLLLPSLLPPACCRTTRGGGDGVVCRGRGVFCTGAPGTTMDLHTRLFVGLCCVLRSACHVQAAQCADCTCFVGALAAAVSAPGRCTQHARLASVCECVIMCSRACGAAPGALPALVRQAHAAAAGECGYDALCTAVYRPRAS